MSAQPDEILPKMAATHAKFLAYVGSLDDAAANTPVGEAHWTPRQIVGHLVDAERAHRRFIEAVAADTPPAPVENFDLDRWNASRVAKRAGDSLAELVAAYDAERAETVRVLQGLPDDAWAKRARHPVFGDTSVEYVARIIGIHERGHLQEMQGG